MKKSIRVSLLVFTLVAALFSFGALWYTRPNVQSYIIDEAKNRQGIPLLEVQEPAKQKPPVELNYDEIAQQIAPQIKNHLLNDVDYMDTISNSLDTKVISAVDSYSNKSIVPALKESIDEKFYVFDDALNDVKNEVSLVDDKVNNIESVRSEDIDTLESNLKQNINSTKSYLENLISNNRIEFERSLNEKTSEFSSVNGTTLNIEEYLPQIVDSILPEVTLKVYEAIENNKEEFFSELYEIANANISEEEAIKLYDVYRNRIIKDITPIIIDELENKYKNYYIINPSLETNEDISSEKSIEENRLIDKEELVEPVVLKDENLEVKTEEANEVVESTNENLVKEDLSQMESNEKEAIKVPTFVVKNPVVVMTPSEYESQRDIIRDKAIQDVLNKLENK